MYAKDDVWLYSFEKEEMVGNGGGSDGRLKHEIQTTNGGKRPKIQRKNDELWGT